MVIDDLSLCELIRSATDKIDAAGKVPDHLLRAMLCASVTEFRPYQHTTTVAEMVHCGLVFQSMSRHGIHPAGCVAVSVPDASSRVFEFTYQCGDAEFYCYSFSDFFTDSVSTLSSTILQHDLRLGCITCGFTGTAVDSDGEKKPCQPCRDNSGRKSLEDQFPVFRSHGQHVLRSIIGNKRMDLLLLFAKHYKEFHSHPQHYIEKTGELLESAKAKGLVGKFLDHDHEWLLGEACVSDGGTSRSETPTPDGD